MKSKKNRSAAKASGKSSTDCHTVVYTRVSAAQQEKEGTSLESQIARCKQQAEEDGLSVDPAYVYKEQGTGADLNRPVLAQLRQAVQAGEVGVVYVCAPNRLSRNPLHLLSLREEFASAGADLRCVRGRSDDAPKGGLPNGTGLGIFRCRRHKVDKVQTADEQEVSLVRLVRELLLKGWSVCRIAVLLNAMDTLTKRGRR